MVHHFRQEEEVLLPVFVRHRPAGDPVIVTVSFDRDEGFDPIRGCRPAASLMHTAIGSIR
jgi:hypothetical protein